MPQVEVGHPSRLLNVIAVAIEKRKGRLSVQPIYESLEDMTRREVKALVDEIAQMEIVHYDGFDYRVKRERNAYRLEAIEEES